MDFHKLKKKTQKVTRATIVIVLQFLSLLFLVIHLQKSKLEPESLFQLMLYIPDVIFLGTKHLL